MKLGAVCGIGWVAGPHEKGKETKSGSIARTTWQEPSRLNEANSLPLSLYFSLSLSPFLPAAPFIPSFSPSQPPCLPSRSKSNSRRVELTGRGPAPTEIDFGKTKRARGRCLCKGERCDTDYGPAELPSDLLCMYREGSLFLHCRRSRLVSSSSPLPALPWS